MLTKELELYLEREKQPVDTIHILYPKYQLRSKEADNDAMFHHTSVVGLYNEKELKRTRKKTETLHQKEIIKVSSGDLVDILENIKIKNLIKDFQEEYSDCKTGRYEVFPPATYYDAETYQNLYDKMKLVYCVYEPYKIPTFGGNFTKWHKYLTDHNHSMLFSNVCWRGDGKKWCFYDKIQKVKFKENQVQWYDPYQIEMALKMD
jgi:hypothetical protein